MHRIVDVSPRVKLGHALVETKRIYAPLERGAHPNAIPDVCSVTYEPLARRSFIRLAD